MGSRESPRVYQKFKKKLAQEKDLLKIIIGLFFLSENDGQGKRNARDYTLINNSFSASLRLTSPARTFPPAYFHFLNSSLASLNFF